MTDLTGYPTGAGSAFIAQPGTGLQTGGIYTYNPADPNFGGAPTVSYWGMSTPSAPAVTPAQAPTPAPVAPHLQFSAQTVGAPTFLLYGNVRVPGQIIWAQDITASNTEVDTSTLSFAVAFGEPIDPTEVVTVNRMWANGTEFYNLGQGGVVDVGNIDSTTIAQLQACIAGMQVYSGSESQTQDPTIAADAVEQGLHTPAYRGLRYIVFIDFPLLIAGNSVPNINVEFRAASSTFLVKDVMVLLAAHFGRALTVSGLDSATCNGLVVQNAITLSQHLANHKPIYGYQILDGDPIRIIRRVVESDLVIDLEVDEEDLIRRNQSPAIVAERIEPSTLPVGVDLHYTDYDYSYDVKTQQARHDGTAASSAIISYSSDYISDATTTRILAYDILYQARSKSLNLAFELTDLRPEVGDVISVTRTNGDVYVCLADKQTNTKTRSNLIQSFALLTSAGVDVDGIGGSTRTRGIWWPENAHYYPLVPTPTRIWSTRYTGPNFNSNPPVRRIQRPSHYATDDVVNAAIPLNPVFGSTWGQMLEDSNYIYYVEFSSVTIMRVPKDAVNVTTQFEILQIPDFCHGLSAGNQGGNQSNSQIHDGKVYIGFYGSNGSGLGDLVLIVIDIIAWDPAAYTAYALDITDILNLGSTAVTENGTIIVACGHTDTTHGRLFCSTVAAPGTVTNVDIAMRPGTGGGASSGAFAYFPEYLADYGVAYRVKHIAVADCSAFPPTVTVVDLSAKDANVVCISQRDVDQTCFCSPTHLFVPCNYTRPLFHVGFEAQSSDSYLARFDHGTLTAAGGKFLGELMYAANELVVQYGAYLDGKLYMGMIGLDGYDGRVIIINEDLDPATAILYPPKGKPIPPNNNFADAFDLVVGLARSGNMFYGSTEVGEPVPGWTLGNSNTWSLNAGHSVWFRFRAPSSINYTVTVSDDTVSAGTGNLHSVQVYTGAAVGALTEIVSSGDDGFTVSTPYGGGSFYSSTPRSVTFAATAGTTYYISIRHDSTNGFDGFVTGGGFGGSIAKDMEKIGNYTITIT